jgi:hypothetical protein
MLEKVKDLGEKMDIYNDKVSSRDLVPSYLSERYFASIALDEALALAKGLGIDYHVGASSSTWGG